MLGTKEVKHSNVVNHSTSGVKEKALNEESAHVQKFEELFHSVRDVTGHGDLEKVVNDFTAKDEANFSKYVEVY